MYSKEPRIYRLAEGENAGTLTVYSVFDGIELVFRDIHAARVPEDDGAQGRFLEIAHCRAGRMERELPEQCFYLMPGDIAVFLHGDGAGRTGYPMSHYHGASVLIDLDRAPAGLVGCGEEVNVRPCELADRCCGEGRCFVAKAEPAVAEVFARLYEPPTGMGQGYRQLKLLELLLLLNGMENAAESRMLPRTQVELAKEAAAFLEENLQRRVTIAELAERMHASQTALKEAFKGVYGVPVYTYVKRRKMQTAARLLENTDHSVLEIAGLCGYGNGSKFATAFKAVMGSTPNEYRVLSRGSAFSRKIKNQV